MTLAEAKKAGAVLAYGNFLTIVINFLIVAIAIFIVVKILNTAKEKMQNPDTCILFHGHGKTESNPRHL